MSAAWLRVRLGEVLRRVERPEIPVPGRSYRQLGVRLWGVGAYEREPIDGGATKYATLSKVESEDIVVNKIWARNGSIAVVQPLMAGCFVSCEFPTFAADRDRLFPQWIHWLNKTSGFWAHCDEKSQGTSGKNRIKPDQFLSVEIPLPPISEQRRIVARIEELAAKIAEARSLRQEATDAAAILFNGAASALLQDNQWALKPLGSILAEPPRNGLSPKAEVEVGGRPMLRINAVSSSPTRFVDLSAFKRVEVSLSEAEPFVLKHNDVFIVRYNGDINRLAKPAIFKGQTDSVFPDKLMRLRPLPGQMFPDFLVYALGCRHVRQQIEGMGKTTAGQIGISGSNVKEFIVPVPPLPEQRLIVAHLDAFQSKVNALKRFQSETAAELDAMLPAILDRAFKGELC